MTDASALFNCCTNCTAPDWSQFKSLEIGGCITEQDGADTFTIGGKSDSEAEFWTVYARRHSDDCEAITDCPTRAAADETGGILSGISGLPVR